MPKGKSAKDYKRISALNKFLGIIMLIALIAGFYFLFVYLMKSGFLVR